MHYSAPTQAPAATAHIVHTPSDGNSDTTSPSHTHSIDTGSTTPEEPSESGFLTITVHSQDLSSLKSIEEAFIVSEPFNFWTCSFCAESQDNCHCYMTETTPGSIPHTKAKLLLYLLSEKKEATLLQDATLSYLLAIDEYKPLGEAFNRDQHHKCGIMHHQLELVKARILDLTKAVQAIPNEDDAVPEGLLSACSRFRDVLSNCYGNTRENHVAFKLNFMLCHAK